MDIVAPYNTRPRSCVLFSSSSSPGPPPMSRLPSLPSISVTPAHGRTPHSNVFFPPTPPPSTPSLSNSSRESLSSSSSDDTSFDIIAEFPLIQIACGLPMPSSDPADSFAPFVHTPLPSPPPVRRRICPPIPTRPPPPPPRRQASDDFGDLFTRRVERNRLSGERFMRRLEEEQQRRDSISEQMPERTRSISDARTHTTHPSLSSCSSSYNLRETVSDLGHILTRSRRSLTQLRDSFSTSESDSSNSRNSFLIIDPPPKKCSSPPSSFFTRKSRTIPKNLRFQPPVFEETIAVPTPSSRSAMASTTSFFDSMLPQSKSPMKKLWKSISTVGKKSRRDS